MGPSDTPVQTGELTVPPTSPAHVSPTPRSPRVLLLAPEPSPAQDLAVARQSTRLPDATPAVASPAAEILTELVAHGSQDNSCEPDPVSGPTSAEPTSPLRLVEPASDPTADPSTSQENREDDSARDPEPALAPSDQLVPDPTCAASEALVAPRCSPPCSSMQRTPTRAAPLQSLLDSISAAVNPVLPTPGQRCGRVIPPNFTPRRSLRIAKADRGLDTEAKAKRVLLLRLGLLKDDEPVSDAILDRYYKLFERPLAVEVVRAFADFYGWHIPQSALDALSPLRSCQIVA